jgi:hypothetical protein
MHLPAPISYQADIRQMGAGQFATLRQSYVFIKPKSSRRAVDEPSGVAWIAGYDETGACVHDFKWTDGGFGMVTGVCHVDRGIWCGGLHERALMRFDLPS